MNHRCTIRVLFLALAVMGLVAIAGANAWAQVPTYTAHPWVFVGKISDGCTVAGDRIVTASWQNGLGLPDNGQLNPGGSTPHQGLVLSKNGPTSDCSSAGVTVVGWNAGDTLSTLGFDYRIGSHCGAGAPRFDVLDMDGNTYYFFGCATGTTSTSPQDSHWNRVIFNSAGAPYSGQGAFVFGQTPVKSIQIVFDEGTDTAGTSDPNAVGLATIDNIRINNTYLTNAKATAVQP